MMEDPELLLTGVGLMENASEEELKNFGTEWLRWLIDDAEWEVKTQLMGSIERNGAGQAEKFVEIILHFFRDVQN